MKDQSPPPIGHNKPPLDEDTHRALLRPFASHIEEAEHWLDGVPVENEDQLKEVDTLLLNVKTAEKLLLQARDSATKPLHDAWKAEISQWKIPLEDLEKLKKGLVRISNAFKVRLAEERELEARRIRVDAEQKMQSARDLVRQLDPGNIHSVRVADQARRDAEEALRAAQKVEKTRPKGLRAVRKWVFIEGDGRRKALHWIARNDRDAVTEFIEGYVARNFRDKSIDGVTVWDEREAY